LKGTRASCAGRTSAVGTSCAGTGVPMPALDAAVTWMLRIPPTWVDERGESGHGTKVLHTTGGVSEDRTG
jgi:hypothetical protein